MKKIFIRESSIKPLGDDKHLLPKHLYKLLKTHTTSLGDNGAFPDEDEYPFDYSIIKQRFEEVTNAIEDLGLESLDEDYLVSELSRMVTLCKRMEEPIKEYLEKLCTVVINDIFSIPEETVNFSCNIVGKVKPEKPVRVLPEPIGTDAFKFRNTEDIKLSKSAVAKRRFINSLIQGAAYTYASNMSLYAQEINKVNVQLLPLYNRIRIINDYLLFIKKDNISDKNIMQGAYVETKVGMNGNRSEIKAQGIIFPLLLQESIKGFFELFSVYGLPSDKKLANYIIKKADFIKAEPWDMRFGPTLWKMVFGGIDDTKIIPYVFTGLIKKKNDEFNLSVREILSSTEAGDEIMSDILKQSQGDSDYQEFKGRIVKKNLDKSIINDGYFSTVELDSLSLDDEGDDSVIEEDAPINGVETWYRGIIGKYNELMVKPQIWLADSPYYAAEYAEDGEDGHLYAIDIDMSRLKQYNWYAEVDSYFDPYDGFSEEEIEELRKEGYNGYMFALDEATVLVLFDKSLIVNIEELPLDEYLDGDE